MIGYWEKEDLGRCMRLPGVVMGSEWL